MERLEARADVMELPDLELVRRAAEDQEAFGLLYERHVRKIYNYIYYRTGDHHDAEDLTARVFQRALRHAYRLLFNSSLRVSEAIDRIRQDGPRIPEVRQLVDFVAASERGVPAWRGVSRLPDSDS